jgi:hypothetical protein
MTVRIFCKCGTEITDEISPWDRKTRTLFWMDQNSPLCAACRKPRASPASRAWPPNARGAEARKKAVAS